MKRSLLALVLGAALLCGCEKPSDQLVGTWEGTTSYDGSAVDNLSNDQRAQVMASIGAPKISLELKSNMNYRLAFGSAGPITGTWKMADNKETVTLTPTPPGAEGTSTTAQQAPPPMLFSLTDDLATIARSDTMFGVQYTLTFKRPAAK